MGLDVNQRTVRFYVAKGLLDKPIKNPYVGADGRVSFFPKESLRRLRKLLQFQNDGYTLDQIQRLLEGHGSNQLRQASVSANDDDWRREVALRYLNDFDSRTGRQAKTEFLVSVSQTEDDQALMAAGKVYLQRRLARIVGPEASQAYVEEYFLKIAPAELERRLALFRRWREDAKPAAKEAGNAYRAIQRLTGNLLLKLTNQADFERQLQRVRQNFVAATSKRGDSQAVESGLEQLKERGCALILAGLDGLLAHCRPPEAAPLAEALEQIKHGHFILTRVALAAEATAEVLEYERLLGQK